MPTKRSHLNTILFIIIFLLLFPLAISPQEKLPLAVMDFKITNVPGDEVDLLIDFLNNALFETGVFDVVQRSRREMLVSELEFSYFDMADSEKTREIGKLLASKLLLFGSIGKIGSRLLFNITTVDVETGKTISAYSKTYTSLEDIIGDFVQIAGDVAHGSLKAMFLKKARMLYSEDFKKREWLETDKLFYQNDRYHIHSPDEDWYTWQNETFSDFVYEVEVQLHAGEEDYGFGIIFRVQDTDNYYLFDITRTGYFKIDKKVDGEYFDLSDWERSTAINAQSVNYLKVEAVGNLLTFFINNNKIKEVFDSTFKGGNIGLFAAGNVHASFDNLKVFQGNLLFYDNFSKISDDWAQTDFAYNQDDEYLILAEGTDYYSWRAETLADISYKAEARYLSGPTDTGFGLLFRFQDIDNNYTFNITRTGYFRLGRYIDGESENLVDWTKSRTINEHGKNILKVECIGSLMKLYINDNQVAEAADDTYRVGQIGLVSYYDVFSAFDNVEVFILD